MLLFTCYVQSTWYELLVVKCDTGACLSPHLHTIMMVFAACSYCLCDTNATIFMCLHTILMGQHVCNFHSAAYSDPDGAYCLFAKGS